MNLIGEFRCYSHNQTVEIIKLFGIIPILTRRKIFLGNTT